MVLFGLTIFLFVFTVLQWILVVIIESNSPWSETPTWLKFSSILSTFALISTFVTFVLTSI